MNMYKSIGSEFSKLSLFKIFFSYELRENDNGARYDVIFHWKGNEIAETNIRIIELMKHKKYDYLMLNLIYYDENEHDGALGIQYFYETKKEQKEIKEGDNIKIMLHNQNTNRLFLFNEYEIYRRNGLLWMR